MTTVPPTAAQVDAWADANLIRGMVTEGLTLSADPWVVVAGGYTQDDGEKVYEQVPDPTIPGTDNGYLRGLAGEYGAVTLRRYSFSFPDAIPAAADIADTAGNLAALNDPSNWVAPA